jgi:hypothetical protein
MLKLTGWCSSNPVEVSGSNYGWDMTILTFVFLNPTSKIPDY